MSLHRTTLVKPWQRLAATVTAATLGVALLAGCGTDAADEKKNDDTPAAGGAFPVTVEHAFGSTEVSKAPERVVTVGYTDDQAVLAFGVKPVGMVDQYPNPAGQTPDINTQWPWVKDQWGDTRPEVVMKNGDAGPNFEKIASLRPDLIIAVYSEVDKAAYEKLSKIAPTVGRTKGEKELFSAPWQDNAVHIAKALGKEKEGAELVKGIQTKLDAAKKAHPEFGGQKAVALSWYKDSISAFTSTDVRGRLITGTGFTYQGEIDKIADGGFSTELSPERIDLIDVDRIFVINDKADTEALKKFELFNNLPAVKNGKVSYLLDSEGPAIGAAMSQGTLLSLPYAIDELVASVK
ncbi:MULTISPECIES: iron-siderophore ABC transporter substrate-binding protein [Streptomyces]|uniref:ABC-type Fe3+-siderophore transporter substrate-binding protein n=1 Tax=Streptomyces griseus subsp. griseus (strain JCM 4626 / CBS 651.72 / NBRC 13350 / KCC S-0626 / ISP 5235) TaxID=455632 RepID=B1VMR8_STRGG|nr:iron-siderophore ABC transporter substrate-binding protein [Streptomyces griseus]MYR16678.1 ABC transporter substrate-binding protein [Streptomyces sp. SID724]MBW3709300.1 iron-siderophore ABC transporter substrate-binding protein [Streptomyces griseus]NEB50952.1 iron-siderophore ABC transporter substrate-binding protein [Streptomyces griseus]SEE32169.1 iron complex transport system substrate-binding protein [Streptomyces griseus]SQA25183.1 ABC-type Fe3+-siderophore transporter substrate-bi